MRSAAQRRRKRRKLHHLRRQCEATRGLIGVPEVNDGKRFPQDSAVFMAQVARVSVTHCGPGAAIVPLLPVVPMTK
jgi:hypothetical protein